MKTTQMGIPYIDCDQCGRTHPAGRRHCIQCGSASAFIDPDDICIHCYRGGVA